MSAIAGINRLPINEAAEAMLKTMKRRGAKSQCWYRHHDNALLYAGKDDRKEIEFLRIGSETYHITFDGAIFNREELLQELNITEPISEEALLLHAYAQWQEGMLDKINGVFAVAILAEQTQTLFLARDRIGVKPLFYMEHDGGLLFASEIKTILSYPGVRAELDADGAAQLLLLGPGRVPGSGVLHNIHEIRPGHYGIYQNGNLKLHRNWRLTDEICNDSLDEIAEKVAFLLQEATKRQMKNCDGIGSMLSGGLDSSVISALANEELSSSGQVLKTFSVDYADSEKYFQGGFFQPERDTDYIHVMEGFLKSQPHWTVLSPEDLADGIAEATIARDLPGMADVDISLLLFCKQISHHADVVLSGECSDEIFGGYPWYRDSRMRNLDGFPWAQSTARRAGLLHPWIAGIIDPADFVHSHYLSTIQNADILPENDAVNRRTKELVNLNFDWFMQTLLDRGDRMSAYWGVDVRMPFCDYRIAQYLYTIPWEIKDHNGQEKGLLRYAMRNRLPDAVLYRKKSPYPKTYDPRFEQIVAQMLHELMQQKDAPLFCLVDRKALQELLQGEFQWPWYGQLMRKPQTIVYLLQLNFWLEHYSVSLI